jgi:predicted exporter
VVALAAAAIVVLFVFPDLLARAPQGATLIGP